MNAIVATRFGVTAAAAVTLLAACGSQKVTFRSEYDKSVDFAHYQTYAFATTPGIERSGYPKSLTNRFEDAIRREMQARGYEYKDAEPDLLVNFNAKLEERVDLNATHTTEAPPAGTYYYGYRDGLYTAWPSYSVGIGPQSEVRYQTGTANVDVVDVHKKQMLWEGVAEGKITGKALADQEKAIDSVVRQLFAKFPGRVK